MIIAKLESMTSARLVTLDVNTAARAAANSLAKPGFGLVIVTGAKGEAVGVLSKSDLIGYLADPDMTETALATLMNRSMVSCGPDDDVHTVGQIMAERSFQNLPVLGDCSRPLGVLDIRDVMKVLFEQEELQERLMANYIAGFGYQ